MNVFPGAPGEVLVVALDTGEDLHDGVLEACRQRGVRHAVVLEGHATVAPAVIHAVTSTGYPIDEHLRTLPGPLELTGMQGLVVDGEMHAHVSLADKGRAYGGHLHAGTRVLYLAEVSLLTFESSEAITRIREAGTDRWLIAKQAAR